jgi:antitoxin Phd
VINSRATGGAWVGLHSGYQPGVWRRLAEAVGAQDVGLTASARGAVAMKYFTANDAKNQFGRLLDQSRAEPVLVVKHGRPVAVVLSYEEYERVEELERAYWAAKAGAADAEGYLGAAETEALIDRRLALRD